ncbi:MAG TPA: TonB-dependent receptor [Candidatus Acidoferrum sp.]|nr:TonB-dependent receptor [Candidatus Acidoferrum sp.]
MLNRLRIGFLFFVVAITAFLGTAPLRAQLGNSGSMEGVVKDTSGAVIPGAQVELSNPVTGYHREATTGADGTFRFANVPFNPYHLSVTANGFSASNTDVDVRSTVPASVQIALKVGAANTQITVESKGEDLVENDPTFHTDVDTSLTERMPLESQSSSVSSLVTLASPGVVADSNGLFHGLGDHAENAFNVDGQPITDQQSKVFSNQIPLDSIQSIEAVSGGPSAEYGDKTSLVVKVTTRSGLGTGKPNGSVYSSYGSFGSVTGGFRLGFGDQKFGNFIAASGFNTSRFLDPPELQAIHDRGNEENLFDRVDFQASGKDSIHVNFQFTRSWFQTPNSIDNLNLGLADPVTGNALPVADQRAQISTYNIAPVWTRLISPTTLFTFGAFIRHDTFNYYPSGDLFADGTGQVPNGSSATLNQLRKLTNAGLRTDISYVKGIHNLKAGATFQHTFLTENFNFGITDPAFNSPCLDANNNPVPDITLTDPAQCGGKGFEQNTAANPNAAAPFVPLLGCFDLTRQTPSANDGCTAAQSAQFPFRGRTDIKEFAAFVQDTISLGNWAFNLGLRADVYRGLVHDWQPEPRVGLAYNFKKTNSVLRASYSRVLETPFNENLILASAGASDPVITAVIGGNTSLAQPIRSGQRNQFNAGFQQAFGKYAVVDADYLWKYTHNAYDFSAFANTPIFFPIAWKNSKIDGPSVRVSVPNYHGLTGLVVLAHVRARYFPPQLGGLGPTVGQDGAVFRIDHDQAFNSTTHLQYQPFQKLPWIGFNWRYDSGLVASNPSVADFPTAIGGGGPGIPALDADQQAAIGLFCGNQVAQAPTAANPAGVALTPAGCAGATTFGSKLLNLAAPGTNDPDHNPSRVKPRNLFDTSVGEDNLFRGDKYKWSLRLTVINLTNKTAAYNFLSTFSGSHFVTPRSYTAELGFHF